MGNLQKLAELNGVAQLEGKSFEDGNKVPEEDLEKR
jgi:hypothetical protein